MKRRTSLITLIIAIVAALGGYLMGGKKQAAPPAPWIDIATDSGERFPFKTVMAKTTNQTVLPLDTKLPAHQFISNAILKKAAEVAEELSREGSPAHEKRRINEVSALFENLLKEKIDELPEFTCQIPSTRQGKTQRSGYPDLRVEHLDTKTVAYLDPKLFEQDSTQSTLRTFYFEANASNTKVTEDALHLLLGFPHDGNVSTWKFGAVQLVDLSKIDLKLKVEFSASNKELYPKTKR